MIPKTGARPSLGVLVTYHNEGELLTECLDTLLSGSDTPDEILIYDDASGDPAERYVKKEHPVRIIRGEENIGIGLARNELMRASQSDFVHFQDADDFFDPRWCAAVRGAIGAGETDLVLNNVSAVEPGSRESAPQRLYDFSELRASKDLLDFFLSEYTYVLVAMSTFRREAALRAGEFLPREVLNFAEDFEFHMRLFALGLKYEVVEEGLVIKRRRPNSLS
ncbi:MAG: glycosyltransferase family 2 protein, partial [Candidatus Omnitrophota bacterium]